MYNNMSIGGANKSSDAASVRRRINIKGMTCQKCERLIREGVEEVVNVIEVQVHREEGFAEVTLRQDSPTVRSAILDVIHSLVNGKFKAKFSPETKDKPTLVQERVDDVAHPLSPNLKLPVLKERFVLSADFPRCRIRRAD